MLLESWSRGALLVLQVVLALHLTAATNESITVAATTTVVPAAGTSTMAPWAAWSKCSGTWRCEGGCYHSGADECIALPSFHLNVNEDVLAQECDDRGGVFGHVCNCRCTEQLHCKFGCYSGSRRDCNDFPEDRCGRRRRHRRWEKKCDCVEVTTYYTTFAENVTFPNPNSCRMAAVPDTRLVKVLLLLSLVFVSQA
mmetsp:Transcript_58748/g.108416  ORF Transcript_58748/g.108416 Transcript_58748/m.108416 type:complete len:197 (-) Transcript_58748:49-639(-)